MKEEKIELRSIERAHYSSIAKILNHHNSLLSETYFNAHDTEKWIESHEISPTSHIYTITSIKTFKPTLIGICGYQNIDWVNRVGEIFLMMDVSEKVMVPCQPSSLCALSILSQIGFQKLNLNRIYYKCRSDNKSNEAFDTLDFHVDGVRRAVATLGGKYLFSTIYSKLYTEFKNDSRYTSDTKYWSTELSRESS